MSGTVWTARAPWKRTYWWHLVAATHGFWVETLCGLRLRRRVSAVDPGSPERCPDCVWLSGEEGCRRDDLE